MFTIIRHNLVLFALLLSVSIYAQFTPGNLIVFRTGPLVSGHNLGDSASPIFLDEYKIADGSNPHAIALPITTNFGTHVNRILCSGSATSEGEINLSANGNYITVTGYDTKEGTIGIKDSSVTNDPRVIFRVDGTAATSSFFTTPISDGFSGDNFRSSVTNTGNDFWLTGNSSGTSAGVRYFTNSVSANVPVTSTKVCATTNNTRVVRINNGPFNNGLSTLFKQQLYNSTASTITSGQGVYAVGSGLPTTTGTTSTIVTGTNLNSNNTFPNSFILLDRSGTGAGPNVMYVADDHNEDTNEGEIYKYYFNGTAWVAEGAAKTTLGGIYGLTGYVDGSGNAVLYVTVVSGNNLPTPSYVLTFTDNAAPSATIANNTFTTIVTSSSAGTRVFRGLAFAPTQIISQPAPQAICANSNAIFTIGMASGNNPVYSYQWFESQNSGATWIKLTDGVNGGVNYSGTLTSSLSLAGVSASMSGYQYKCVAIYMSQAYLTSNTATLTVTPAVTGIQATAGATTICSNSSLSLFGTAIAATAYSWTGPNGFLSTLQNPVINNASTSGAGAYIFTASNGCSNEKDTVVVQIDSAVYNLAITASPNDTICSRTSISLNATGNNVSNWSWTGPNNFTSTLQNPLISNLTTLNTGKYFVTTANACGTFKDSAFIQVDAPIQNLTVSALPDSVCTGANIALNASGTNATHWSWAGPAGFSSTLQNPLITAITTPRAGQYVLTALNACGSARDSVFIYVDTVIQNLLVSALPNDTVCSGSSITLSTTGLDVSNWTWTGPNGFLSLLQSPVLGAVNQANSGSYYLTASNSCGTKHDTIAVFVEANVISLTASSSLQNDSACSGTAVHLFAGGSVFDTYQWTGPAGFNSTLQNPTLHAATTNYSGLYIVRAINVCGSKSDSLVIQIDSAISNLTASVASGGIVCSGISVTLNATGTHVHTWQWTGPAGFTSGLQNPSLGAVTPANSGTYFLQAANACGTSSSQINLLVEGSNSVLTVSSSAGNDSICHGTALHLFSGTNFDSYFWTGPNGFSSTLQNPVIANAITAQSGAYVVTGSTACGVKKDTIIIQIDTLISAFSASVLAHDSVCTGSNVTLKGTGNNIHTWLWTGPNGYSSTNQNSNLAGVQPAATGIYKLTVSNACGNTSDSIRLTVEASVLSLAASSSLPHDSACFSQTIHLFASGSVFDYYAWTGPQSFTSSLQNPAITNAATGQSGNYIVTAGNSCGTVSDTVRLQIDTLITGLRPNATPNDTVCVGTNVTLHSAGSAISQWLWQGPNGFTSSLPAPVLTNTVAANTGYYIVTARNACGNARDSVLLVVESNAINLSATASGVHDSSCSGQVVHLFANGTSFTSYNWTGPAGFISSLQNPIISDALISQSGIYVVMGTNVCGTASDSVKVIINTIPASLHLSTSVNNNQLCQGQTITLTASSAENLTWHWAGPQGFTSGNASFTINSIQPNQQGYYVVTGSNACGSQTDSVDVTVFTLPNSVLVNTGADSICPGQSTILQARSGLQNITWNNNQIGNTITVNQPGSYYYSATAAHGCSVMSDTLAVHLLAAPVLDLFSTNKTTVCAGQVNIALHASSDPTVFVTWLPGNVVSDSLVVSAPGQYIAIARKNGCTVSDSIVVTQAAAPVVHFADSNITSCCQNVHVTPTVTGSALSYKWSDSSTDTSDLLIQSGVYALTVLSAEGCSASGAVNFNKVCIAALATAVPDTIHIEETTQLNVSTAGLSSVLYQWSPSDHLTGSTIANPVADPKKSMTYKVVVRDTQSGCQDTATVDIVVLYNAYFGVPNVFTPNNDGNNDTWHIVNQGGQVTVQSIRIYDRWGEVVFDSDRDNSIEWDGHYQGKLQEMGNYVYNVMLKINATGEEKHINGNLSLIP